MSRKFYDPVTGADSTTAVQAAITNKRTIWLADLVYFNFWNFQAFVDYDGVPTTIALTNADFPIQVTKLQLGPTPSSVTTVTTNFDNYSPLIYSPQPVELGQLNYEIGFNDQSLEVNWAIDDTVNYWQGGSMPFTLRQALVANYLNGVPLWVHRAVFSDDPTNGGTFLGVTLMFRGAIKGVVATRDTMKIQLASLMHIFQQVNVPTQLIEPNPRSQPYMPLQAGRPAGYLGYATGTTNPFALTFSSNYVDDHSLADAFLTTIEEYGPPANNSSVPTFLRIRDNTWVGNVLTLYFYEILNPNIGIDIAAFGYMFLPNIVTSGAPGFPSVPPPEIGL